VKYELGFYIPEDDILHSHCRGNFKSYTALTGWTLYWRRNVSPVKYKLGFHTPEEGILQIHCRERVTSSNIKMDLVEIGWCGMDWIILAQDWDRRRAFVLQKMLATS
jgi:hypothetical protein